LTLIDPHPAAAATEDGPVDVHDVLRRLSQLIIQRWHYKGEDDVEHIGPMAQDFAAAFGLGVDDRTIHTGDALGVALAAIQALHQLAADSDLRIADLEARLAALTTDSIR
jgi:hypothetical protein